MAQRTYSRDGYGLAFSQGECVTNDLISVIIPAYQKGEAVRACLSSICAQTHSNLEIIVVFLRGTDDTLDIIRSFDDPRLKIIEQKEKTGPGGARNIGMAEAKGSYIGFIDCDDAIPTTYFEELLRALQAHAADMAMGQTVLVSKRKKQFLVRHRGDYALDSFEDKYALLNNGAAFDKLFKADFLKKFNLEFPVGVYWEDNLFLLQSFWYGGKMAVTRNATYFYTLSDRSLNRERLKKDIPLVARQMLDFAQKNSFSSQNMNLVRRKILENFVGKYVLCPKVRKELIPLFGGKILFGLALSQSLFNILLRQIRPTYQIGS